MNIKFFEHFVGHRILSEIQVILGSLVILFLSYWPISFSYFIGNLLLFNYLFFLRFFTKMPLTIVAYILVGILADLRFDAVLGFYAFNFVLMAIVSEYIHEYVRAKKYAFLWRLNFFFVSLLYAGEYILNSLIAHDWFNVMYLGIKLCLAAMTYPGIMFIYSKISDQLFDSHAA